SEALEQAPHAAPDLEDPQSRGVDMQRDQDGIDDLCDERTPAGVELVDRPLIPRRVDVVEGVVATMRIPVAPDGVRCGRTSTRSHSASGRWTFRIFPRLVRH